MADAAEAARRPERPTRRRRMRRALRPTPVARAVQSALQNRRRRSKSGTEKPEARDRRPERDAAGPDEKENAVGLQ
jgi:hypothetical protein